MPAVGFHARRDAAHRDVARWTEEETRRFWLSEGNDTETVRVLHALCSSSGRQDATAKAESHRSLRMLLKTCSTKCEARNVYHAAYKTHYTVPAAYLA
jgi:hypothetical protein